MNRKLFKMECSKAFRNKFFYIALGIGLAFTFLSFLYNIDKYHLFLQNLEKFETGNPQPEMCSLYNSWIGGEPLSLGMVLFYTLIPLVAAIPFGWSFCQERNSGYLKCVATRCNRRSYYMAKYAAVFLSGGAVIAIPLLFNFLLTACFVPAYKPSIILTMYYAVQYPSLWSGIFYLHPAWFVILYLILDFIFAGLFATMSYAISLFVKNWFAVVILPFLCILVLHYSRTLLEFRVYKEISPLNYLHATCLQNKVVAGIVLVEGLIFLLVPLCLILREGVKGEIL